VGDTGEENEKEDFFSAYTIVSWISFYFNLEKLQIKSITDWSSESTFDLPFETKCICLSWLLPSIWTSISKATISPESSEASGEIRKGFRGAKIGKRRFMVLTVAFILLDFEIVVGLREERRA
jgi:hypothetical protein